MKKIIKIIIISIVFIFLFYVSGAFIGQEFDITKWDIGGRTVFTVFVWIIILFTTTGVLISDE